LGCPLCSRPRTVPDTLSARGPVCILLAKALPYICMTSHWSVCLVTSSVVLWVPIAIPLDYVVCK
jgi:hypothetical protein